MPLKGGSNICPCFLGEAAFVRFWVRRAYFSLLLYRRVWLRRAYFSLLLQRRVGEDLGFVEAKSKANPPQSPFMKGGNGNSRSFAALRMTARVDGLRSPFMVRQAHHERGLEAVQRRQIPLNPPL